jgi:hypothetical protein
MVAPRGSCTPPLPLLFLAAALFGLTCCARKLTAQTPVDLQLKVNAPFRFVAYGDTRFHDPSDTEAANPAVRVLLVHAIAEVNPACRSGISPCGRTLTNSSAEIISLRRMP